MLTNTSLRDMPRTDVFVVADTATSHVVTLLAKVIQARNPLLVAPPANSIVWREMGKSTETDPVMDMLQRAVMDPTFLREGSKPTAAPDDVTRQWLIAATNLGLSGLLTFPRAYLNDIPSAKSALDILTSEARSNFAAFKVGDTPLAALIEKDPLRVPFAQLALDLAYEQLLRSGVFNKLTPTENASQVEKGNFAIFERGLLLRTMMRLLAVQTVLLRVRPLLRYLRTEQCRARLREEFVASNVEYWENIIDQILTKPVHPWIARAEEATLPANRATPWGPSTPTILLERGFLMSPWQGRGQVDEKQRAAYARQMDEKLDAPGLLHSLEGLLKDLRTFFDELETDGRMAKVASVLNFTLPRTAIPIPLWGMSFHPFYTDGLNSTESVPDLIAASFQVHLPAQNAAGSPWIGEDDVPMNYYGGERNDGSPTVWTENVGTISVAPQDVVMDEAFYTARFSPAMFRYRKLDYRGDLNAVVFPPTYEAIGQMIGKTAAQVEKLVQDSPMAWHHIFTRPVDGFVATHADDLLFYSDRTAMTWLTEIKLPRLGAPSVMWVQRRGRVETALPVRAKFLRDPSVPAPTVPLQAAVDRLIAEATPATITGTP